MPSSFPSPTPRYAWVDFAKGICMIAVVAMYINTDLRRELTRGHDGFVDTGWFHYFVSFAAPFRMPDFFLISGLFLSRVIGRPWRTYIDNRVLHYVYFFVLWSGILLVSRSAGEIAQGNIGDLVAEFLHWLVQPFAMMWFIAMLAVYSLFTRFTRGVPIPLMLAIAAGLQIWGYKSEWDMVQHFGERYVYFYIGYVFAPAFFRLADWTASRRGMAWAAFVAWAALNSVLVSNGWAGLRGVSLALGVLGASAVMVLARLLCDFRRMDWLRNLGEHSLPIYVGFYIPMSVATQIVARHREWVFDFGTVALGITIFSICCALALYWATRWVPARYLFERPAWARITSPRPTASSVVTSEVAG